MGHALSALWFQVSALCTGLGHARDSFWGVPTCLLQGEATQSYGGACGDHPTQHPRRLSSVVLSLSGIREWFCGRQLFHRQGRGGVDASGSNVSDGEQWGEADEASLTHPSLITHLLLSGPVPKRSQTSTRGLGTPVLAPLPTTCFLAVSTSMHPLLGWLAGPQALFQDPFRAAAPPPAASSGGTQPRAARLPLHPKGTEERQAVLWIKKSLPLDPILGWNIVRKRPGARGVGARRPEVTSQLDPHQLAT